MARIYEKTVTVVLNYDDDGPEVLEWVDEQIGDLVDRANQRDIELGVADTWDDIE